MAESDAKKPSILAAVAGAALIAGPLLPWIVIRSGEDKLGLSPGTGLWDERAGQLLESLGVTFWTELALFAAAAALVLMAGFSAMRPRLAAGLGVVAGFGAVGVLLVRLAGAITTAGDRVAELPGFAQAWVGEGVANLAALTSFGPGLWVSMAALAAAVAVFVKLAPEAVSDRTWLTPLAERFWFFELVEDFWFFLRERKAWWMTPIVVVLLLLVVLILVGEKAAVLPFIYTLF